MQTETTRSSRAEKPLIIIDGFGFVFRAYHVQSALTSPKGEPVGAIYGLTSMLIKLIAQFKPENAVMVLDHAGKNFRHQLYPAYKANRPAPAEDLIQQLALVPKVAEALNFKYISKQGYEADDIIASLAKQATKEKKAAIIISSDKDLMQLVNDHVKMFDPMKARFINEEDIIAKFGVGPQQVREVQALMGDKSDNIPGVTGIGPKMAAQLVNQFGDLATILASIDQISSKRQQELLRASKEEAQISWQLVELKQDILLDYALKDLTWLPPASVDIMKFLHEYGFKSLIKRVENLFKFKNESLFTDEELIEKTIKPVEKKVIKEHNISSQAEFEQALQQFKQAGYVAILSEQIEEKNYLIFAVNDEIYRLAYQDEFSEKEQDLFSINQAEKQTSLNIEQVTRQLFADTAIQKITFDLKKLLKLSPVNFCTAFEDLQIMEYILNAGNKSRQLVELIEYYLAIEVKADQLLWQAIYMKELYEHLLKELYLNKALSLYKDIDLPLAYLLDEMEKNGIKVNLVKLAELSQEFSSKITLLEKQIYQEAGEKFNIASPKQLGDILFNKMKLPFAKISGKSKAFVTNVDILEKLKEDNHEIAKLLLQWRHFTKLKNTYTDALPKLANIQSARIHTNFLQTVTSTGRLSSTQPNIQNIPIRSEEGNKIRSCFITNPGMKLISADYSQIELRILSHVAKIESLRLAMAEKRDIHAQTASEIFRLAIDEITPELRRSAKAINFGIIYGISSYGLAKQLNITTSEAASYIERYFAEYPGIQKYMEETISYAQSHGYVKNMLGRKCHVPTINHKNHTLQAIGKRAAINAPMQSLASDIVKIAMLKLARELKKRQLQTKMLLQIHDELIFEAPEFELEEAQRLIKSVMQSALQLDVKIAVSVNAGNNWQEIH